MPPGGGMEDTAYLFLLLQPSSPPVMTASGSWPGPPSLCPAQLKSQLYCVTLGSPGASESPFSHLFFGIMPDLISQDPGEWPPCGKTLLISYSFIERPVVHRYREITTQNFASEDLNLQPHSLFNIKFYLCTFGCSGSSVAVCRGFL